MPKHTVVWWPPALDDLTVLWMHSNDRKSIQHAADAIDGALNADPSIKGSHVR
jgi:hypothetical protein